MTVLEEIVNVDKEDIEADVDMDLLDETIVDYDDHLTKDSKNHRKTKDWVIDSTVPFGWSYKGEGFAASIKAPNGKLYPSRRLAFADMLNSGKYSVKDIVMMKSTLVHEGWKSDVRIPKGWMLRKRLRSNGYRFIGQGGELFKSTIEALKFVEKYRKYFSEEDVDKIKKFNSHSYNQRSRNVNKERNLDDWILNDESIPRGWRIKRFRFGKLLSSKLLSPEGRMLQGRRVALKYMIDENYPKDKIEEMRALLKFDGWLSDSKLPEKWFYKKAKSGNMVFVSPSGEYFKSRESVRLSTDVMQDEKIAMENFQKCINGVYQIKTQSLDNWTFNDTTVPKEWGIKKFSFGKNTLWKLLSPQGTIFQGRRAALKFMIDEKYPDEKIEEMRSYLKYDGWLSDPRLPEKWFFKKSKNHNASFVSANGQYFKTKESVRVNQKCFTSEEIHKIVNFTASYPQSGETENSIEEDGWRFDDTGVPKGWGIRELTLFGNDRKTVQLLSPAPWRKVIQGKMSALRYMVQENHPEEKLEEMRECLRRDGWLVDTNLPKNWLYHKTIHHFKLLSPDGQYFRSKGSAKKSFPDIKF